jgi:hypothetical protein
MVRERRSGSGNDPRITGHDRAVIRCRALVALRDRSCSAWNVSVPCWREVLFAFALADRGSAFVGRDTGEANELMKLHTGRSAGWRVAESRAEPRMTSVAVVPVS